MFIDRRGPYNFCAGQTNSHLSFRPTFAAHGRWKFWGKFARQIKAPEILNPEQITQLTIDESSPKRYAYATHACREFKLIFPNWIKFSVCKFPLAHPCTDGGDVWCGWVELWSNPPRQILGLPSSVQWYVRVTLAERKNLKSHDTAQTTETTGWAKKVIPLVHILHCTRGITFLADPVCVLANEWSGEWPDEARTKIRI